MTRDDEAELYKRINAIESKVDSTNGYLKGVVDSNEKLIALLEKRDTTTGRIISALIVLLLLALGVIAYGAIGERGMKTVRDTLPTLPTHGEAVPTHNDFDKWTNHKQPKG